METNYTDNYLEELLEEDPRAANRIIDIYTPTAWTIDTGIAHKSDFSKDQYSRLIEVVSPNKVVNAIKALYGELPDISEHFPMDYDGNDNSILLKQFLWIHNSTINEDKNSGEP